jgi:hypothetical protein
MVEILMNWLVEDLNITVDAVLRGQGADPDEIRTRSPRLVDIAQQALSSTLELLEPVALIKDFPVLSLQHDCLKLNGGKHISGPLMAGHLAGSKEVKAVVCTVGSKIDEYASRVMEDDIVLGLAIDGVGSAGVEAFANLICSKVEIEADKRGFQSTIPLSPGMIGWDVEEGQPIIFDLLDPSQIGVELTAYNLMVPRKSLSMIIGLGPGIHSGQRLCDFCAMRVTCRYQDHYGGTHA